MPTPPNLNILCDWLNEIAWDETIIGQLYWKKGNNPNFYWTDHFLWCAPWRLEDVCDAFEPEDVHAR